PSRWRRPLYPCAPRRRAPAPPPEAFLAQKRREPSLQRALVARLAFPDDERGPAGALQRAQRFGVAGAVAGDLGPPVGGVVLGLARAALAIVPVPEAAVHEHGLAHGGEHKVGLARELAAVEPIAP